MVEEQAKAQDLPMLQSSNRHKEMTMDQPQRFYRYEDIQFENGPHVRELEFALVRETPNGWWIKNAPGHYGILDKPKWVSKTSRKRYAYPTKEEAMANFRARKTRQIEILRYRLDRAIRALEKAGGKVPKDYLGIARSLRNPYV